MGAGQTDPQWLVYNPRIIILKLYTTVYYAPQSEGNSLSDIDPPVVAGNPM